MRIDGIIFDLGNTLVPWGDREGAALLLALEETFTAATGPIDGFGAKAARVRDRLIRAREDSTLREVTVDEFVDAMCDGAAPAGLADAVAEKTRAVFPELCRVPDGLPELLDRLAVHRPLAVLSNFFLAEPVHDVLARAGLADKFVHVEVSAAQGFMKPHPAPFDYVREKLGTAMERTLMVGDDFYADIVGGHRAGLLTALTHEHKKGPTSDPRDPDVAADRILESLHELDA